jgi:hypothetical protein
VTSCDPLYSFTAEVIRARIGAESLGWLAMSESSFSLWDNEEDKVWDDEAEEPVDRARG